ncbi:hypothetical protein M758_11G153000 [Ceratodon purpureus]|nr:hypothetical protein M758_11G153000 [Ceratodon purpureus]
MALTQLTSKHGKDLRVGEVLRINAPLQPEKNDNSAECHHLNTVTAASPCHEPKRRRANLQSEMEVQPLLDHAATPAQTRKSAERTCRLQGRGEQEGRLVTAWWGWQRAGMGQESS